MRIILLLYWVRTGILYYKCFFTFAIFNLHLLFKLVPQTLSKAMLFQIKQELINKELKRLKQTRIN